MPITAVFVSGTEQDLAQFQGADAVFESGSLKYPSTLTVQGTYIQLSATSLSNTLLPLWVADNSYQVTSIRGRNSVAGTSGAQLVFNKVSGSSIIGSGVTLMNSFYDLTTSIGTPFQPALLGSAVNSGYQANLTFNPGDWLIATPVGSAGAPISSWQVTLQRI